jgi:type I restriction enzyme R subunit
MTPGTADIEAEISLRMEEIIRKHAVVRWRENPDAQNRMRNDMDDFLFELQNSRGLTLTLEQMDSLIESCLAIARNRPNDV